MFSSVVDCPEYQDESGSVAPKLRAELIYHGMVFLTEYPLDCEEGDMIDYGTLIARNLEHAKQRTEERGYGETVLGVVKSQS